VGVVTATETPLAGAYVFDLNPRRDDRGFFVRTFCAETFRRLGLVSDFPQANQSRTTQRGVVRGLHFQHPPHTEVKVVRCTRGAVWDVFVDLRAGSPTLLKWHAVELSEENFRVAYIPVGFAHGFQTLTADCDVQYLVSAVYTPSAEGRVRYDDPRVGVRWPLPVAFVSPKDAAAPLLAADFRGIVP
jgi:dTDP-4-dehydrorhamnose 3,5-epimerase